MTLCESITLLEKEQTHKVSKCPGITVTVEKGVNGVVDLSDFYLMFVLWEFTVYGLNNTYLGSVRRFFCLRKSACFFFF